MNVASVSRCGQHAFCNWLCKQSESSIFENWVRTIEGAASDNRLTDRDYYNTAENNEAKLIVKLYENYNEKDFKDKIILLRDPFNWLASLLASRNRDGVLGEYIRNYKHLYKNKKECLLYVSYNKWCCSQDYRKSICSYLNIGFTDIGIEDVPKYGNGSTFSYREYDGMGSHMKTLERYKIVVNNECSKISRREYVKIFEQDKELLEIAITEFGMGEAYDTYIR